MVLPEEGATLAANSRDEPLATVEHRYAHGELRLTFFRCVPSGPVGPLPENCRWVAPRELTQYEFPPANAALVRMLAQGEKSL